MDEGIASSSQDFSKLRAGDGGAGGENGLPLPYQETCGNPPSQVIPGARGKLGGILSTRIPHAGSCHPWSKTGQPSAASESAAASLNGRRCSDDEKSPVRDRHVSSPSTDSGEVNRPSALAGCSAYQVKTAPSKKEQPTDVEGDTLSLQTCASSVNVVSRNANIEIDSTDVHKNTTESQCHYVYDGGGQQDGGAGNGSGHLSTTPDVRSGSKSVPGYPADATLLPKPEEQIGPPPPYAKSVSLVPPPEQTPVLNHGLQGETGKVTLLLTPPAYISKNRSAKETASGENLSDSTSWHDREDESYLLGGESDTSQDTSCSKRFIHCTLRYKAKCRIYKFVAVAACYLTVILLILTLKSLRLQQRGESMEIPSEYEDVFREVELREKRFAGRLHVGGLGVAKNETEDECAPHFDENHNEIYIMSYDAFIKGGWVVHVIIGIYTFAAIAAICDIYFVPALEHICEDLKLEADVAGATFMAAASSAPEFCTSVIGIFVQESDVGLGAIVGSSIFNLLAIVGLCSLFAGMPVELSWYPLSRDSIFYTVAVFEMLAFMYDTKVHWYEALVMIVTYSLYILVMVYNKKIEQLANATEPDPVSRQSSFLSDIHRTHSARLEIIRARSHSRVSAHQVRVSATRLKHLSGLNLAGMETQTPSAVVSTVPGSNRTSEVWRTRSGEEPSQDWEKEKEKTTDREGSSADPRKAHILEPQSTVVESIPTPVMEVEPEEAAVAEYENPLEFPESWPNRIYWIAVLPVTVLHAYTIPDSRIQDSWQSKFYMIPFALSVLYLAIYSYIMVWAMSVAAWGLDIPATVTGLTILAAGTSVPDCLSSIFVARDGYGDMAVSNAIGSNVFDILLCLGVPWLVTSFKEKDGHAINSEGMFVAGSTLVVTIVYLIVSLRLCNWTLTPWYGFLTLVVYVAIIIFCILVELNIIFNFHPDRCG